MAFIDDYLKARGTLAPPKNESPQIKVSEKVISLAYQLTKWHDARPVPERWNPVQLGRLAATLGTSNEVMAATLKYAGWTERKQGTYSLWAAPIK